MLERYPSYDFVTVDDDVFYSPDTLEILYNLHMQYPKDICCRCANELTDIYSIPSKWHGNLERRLNHVKNIRIIGIGGVYYPADSLYKDATNTTLQKRLCPWADDIWLTMMGILNGTYFSKEFIHCNPIDIWGTQKVSLSHGKKSKSKTDLITNDEQWTNLIGYYSKEIKKILEGQFYEQGF